MDVNTISIVFILFIIACMLMIQYWIIPVQVAQQNQTTAIHWTLVAGNAILILFNIFMRNAVGSAISGTVVGMNLPTIGGKRK